MDMNIDFVNVIASITATMPCYKCPYPCEKKENASQACCNRQWYKILRNMKTEEWEQVQDKLFAKFCVDKE